MEAVAVLSAFGVRRLRTNEAVDPAASLCLTLNQPRRMAQGQPGETGTSCAPAVGCKNPEPATDVFDVKTYVFTIELRQDPDARWSVWVPGFPGLASWGHTKEEALGNIRDAAEGYLRDLLDAGDPVPPPGRSVRTRGKPTVAVTL